MALIPCPHCGKELVFYDVALDEKAGKVKDTFVCDKCGAKVVVENTAEYVEAEVVSEENAEAPAEATSENTSETE